MHQPRGCGVGWPDVDFVDVTFFGAALVSEVVDIAETKKNAPANAIVLSI